MDTANVVLTTELAGLSTFIKGKVRDVYDLDYHLLVVTTDRISAYDCVMQNGIPGKGQVLNQLSTYWFQQIQNLCPSHYISIDLDQIMDEVRLYSRAVNEAVLDGRSMLVNKTKAFPVECVVRGYLDGSGWREYRESGMVCGIELPPGLQQGSRLPEPIFTPASKNSEGHDENITVAEMDRIILPAHARQMRELSLAVYRQASEHAWERGIIIADTKFEFGLLGETVVMIDECLTPDSSRFWDAEGWEPGGPQPSFDKQFVRDHLDSTGWNHEPPAPALPNDVVRRTSEKYHEIYRRLTD